MKKTKRVRPGEPYVQWLRSLGWSDKRIAAKLREQLASASETVRAAKSGLRILEGK